MFHDLPGLRSELSKLRDTPALFRGAPFEGERSVGSGAPVGGPWAAPIDLRGSVPDSGECPADFCVSDW